MSAIPAQDFHTVEDYLAMERSSLDVKHEYVDGKIYAMVGASREHNLIAVNIARELSSQLNRRPCEAYVNDMRVKPQQAKRYYYPDLVVVCGKPVFEDDHNDTLLNPGLLIEILSASTEAYDRGGKFTAYRRIESLREYLLVAQDKPFIEHYLRQGGVWVLTETEGLEDAVRLESIGCILSMNEVYDRVFDGLERDG